MTTQQTSRWYDDFPALDQPVPDVAGAQRARTDRALARLRASEQRIDRQMVDDYFAWMERTDPFMQPED